MSSALQLQPAFRVQLPVPVDEARSRLRAVIQCDELSSHAESAGRVLDYKVERELQRFWSPHLSVHLSPDTDDNSTEAYCRFSPRPEIWTMVMAIYLVATCCVMGALVFGLVQWMMKNPPWAFLAVPVGCLMIAGLHLASLIGQSWSRDQMSVLKQRWERTVELAFPGER